jgi:hypothetical protein
MREETFWKPKRRVWFQKNDDGNLGAAEREAAIERELAKTSAYWAPENKELRESVKQMNENTPGIKEAMRRILKK